MVIALAIGMMAVEESHTGIAQNEDSSVWGVLPWRSMFTMVIFLPAATLMALVSMLVILRNAAVLW